MNGLTWCKIFLLWRELQTWEPKGLAQLLAGQNYLEYITLWREILVCSKYVLETLHQV